MRLVAQCGIERREVWFSLAETRNGSHAVTCVILIIFYIVIEPTGISYQTTLSYSRARFYLKARLHMRFSMRFWCDFNAILRTKSAPAYPARVYSRVTLRQNTAKLAEIRKKGVFK